MGFPYLAQFLVKPYSRSYPVPFLELTSLPAILESAQRMGIAKTPSYSSTTIHKVSTPGWIFRSPL